MVNKGVKFVLNIISFKMQMNKGAEYYTVNI